VDLTGDGSGLGEAPASGPTTLMGNYIGLGGDGFTVVQNTTYGVLAGAADDVRAAGSRRCARRSAILSAVHELALFLHLIGVLLFVGGIVVAGVAFESARRRRRPAEIALLLGLTRVGVALVGGGALLLLGAGLWLVGVEEDVGFGTGWVDAAIALFVAAMALGGWAGQRPKRARRLAARLAEEDGEAGELRALLDDPASRAANYASALLVLAILALMVFKP
jgi:uncharacterized membrane protein